MLMLRLTHLYKTMRIFAGDFFRLLCACQFCYFTLELNTDVWRRRNNVDELHAVENWLRRKIYINATATA